MQQLINFHVQLRLLNCFCCIDRECGSETKLCIWDDVNMDYGSILKIIKWDVQFEAVYCQKNFMLCYLFVTNNMLWLFLARKLPLYCFCFIAKTLGFWTVSTNLSTENYHPFPEIFSSVLLSPHLLLILFQNWRTCRILCEWFHWRTTVKTPEWSFSSCNIKIRFTRSQKY